jgi:hypothetical protein
MVKVVFRKGDIKKGMKYGVVAGTGSTLFIAGLIIVIIALIKGTKGEKELWCPIGLVLAAIGWKLVRHVSNNTGESIAAIFISTFLNPFDWF